MRTTAALDERSAGGGFTLIELLLTVVLVLLLLGAVVMNFTSLQTGSQLEEGAEQFESLVRFARAHAASTGCKVRLSFEEAVDEDLIVPLGNVFVSWEPDPLHKPGEFHPLVEVSPLLENLLRLLEVDEVRPLEGRSMAVSSLSGEVPGTSDAPGDAGYAAFAPITFYADGSSDSAEVIVRARESDDARQMAVRIIGATGVVKRGIVRNESVTEAAADSEGPNAN